jgi:hypothetical protein
MGRGTRGGPVATLRGAVVVRTFWILLAVVAAVSLIVLLRKKSSACDETCDVCEGCGEILSCPFECCPCHCTIGSLLMLASGVVALWGGGLAAVGWLVLSLTRS